ncbi:flagellar biosynthetic protein FliR [Nocardioides humilatus]|uniref:Flagellar biosynthetic protein FliR n=1 Tax=Nocardioides humilatus TaxID=2607660 RepID=A0A5B1LD15_9ACTN|nr:flagellar biosynthetic protein FliR [Nocardioides humilatus]KAA1417690.1 flagellar biosynthetic protein FliR [Nocardioides humilatus]
MTLTVAGAPVLALFLASVRVVAWLALVPPFSTRDVPAMAKVVIAIGLSFTVAPGLAGERLPRTTPEVLMAVVGQAVVGLGLGFVTMLLISALAAAGSLIDLFGGFSLAAAWDPLALNSNSVFGRFHQMVAIVLLLASGGHLIMIGGLLSTFDYLPLTGLPPLGNWSDVLTTAFSMFFTIAVQIALPMVAVLFIADLTLALMTKVAPQLQALTVMFPAKIGLTLLVVGLSFPVLPGATERLVALANEAMAAMAGA